TRDSFVTSPCGPPQRCNFHPDASFDRLEGEPIQSISGGIVLRELLRTPRQPTLQFLHLTIPPGTGSAGFVELDTQSEVSVKSRQKPRLIMGNNIAGIGTCDSSADDRRYE